MSSDAPPSPAQATSARHRADGWSRAAALITAVTALGALVFTALSLTATRDQLAAGEQGQITDRYSNAIDQIGTPGVANVWMRVGGIFALERIAVDSARDRRPIVEVLTSFLHGTSPRATSTTVCPKVAADVEAAFLVLTRGAVGRERAHHLTDLRHTCLAAVRADDNADLSRISFVGSDLHEASLLGAHGGLIGFSEVTLTHAVLARAELSDFVFWDGADLAGANLSGARLHSARLTDVVLTGADVTDADFSNATLTRVNLVGAKHDDLTKTAGTTYDNATIGAWW